MTCVHLRRLYQICQQEGVKLSAPDLIHIVCPQCGEKEVCPSMLMDDVEALEQQEAARAQQAATPPSASTDKFSV